MPAFIPNINVRAVNANEHAVATLPGVPYRRKLAGVTITGVAGSRCELYLGAHTPSNRFDQTSRGQSNSSDYSTPRTIPANTPVLVVWVGMGSGASACQATFNLAE